MSCRSMTDRLDGTLDSRRSLPFRRGSDMPRFIYKMFLPGFLVTSLTSGFIAADENLPIPDAAYGRIELQEPLPNHANIYANWLHDSENGFRILVPPMSKVHCPNQPIQKGASKILLRIEPIDMLALEIGLIPKTIKGKQLTAEQILGSIAADEKTEVIRKDSTMGTSWIGRGYRTLGKDAPPQTMTMLTSTSQEDFVFARIRSRFPLELRTALAILDSFDFVEPDFELERVLTMHEASEAKTETVPATTVKGWFEAGRPNGLVTHEDERGRRVYSMTWLNGQKSGLELRHWPSGGVYRLRLFEYGVSQVQSLSFYESGELHSMSDVQNGVLEGNSSTFYRDGSISNTVKFKNSRCHGTMTHYLPDGRLIGRTFYEHGEQLGEESLLGLSQSETAMGMESVLHPGSVWNAPL
ncbi:toxin-antitoxin system YwqK family antitoxin [Planctomycetaceae bacterium SH139]